MDEEISLQEKLAAIFGVANYRPTLTAGIVGLSAVAAVLEGIGLSFILPVIEYARGSSSSSQDGLIGAFSNIYEFLGIPFTLEYIVLGASLVMVVRYTTSFIVAWLRVALRTDYIRYLRRRSFRGALNAEIGYFDEEGSDDILNAIITQSKYSSQLIERLVNLLEIGLVSIVYLVLALYMAPYLTLFALVVLGLSTYLLRNVFESGYAVGSRVAEANERIQGTVQAGTQGIRDVKLFGMASELFSDFEDAIDLFVEATIKQYRNQVGIDKFQQLVSALAVFVLIYLGLKYASISIGGLGVFLFAMFRLSPRISTLNNLFYKAETELPHLVRSQQFIERIELRRESGGGDTVPDSIDCIEFDGITFSYDESEQTLLDVSFEVEDGEFIAFVGPSGAGKSTIVSMLTRLYEPDLGAVRVNGTSIDAYDIGSWRDRIAVVRQQPFIFNDTIRYNITIGNRDATQEEIERVAEVARVTEFLHEMPHGYETALGDNGVRLSGGQKQRVALARALLKDAEILILDEATSDLDTNIEAEVQSAIESMDEDYITLTVAHRLSTVKNADRIYTVVEGEITDRGSHGELLERDGKYADLYAPKSGSLEGSEPPN